jgi:isopentenyl-diphosphate delta-isomerase type 1
LDNNSIEYFDIVDENCKVIGRSSREICHNGSKFLHPVVHIHIFNSKNELLLQKRKITKDIQPGKWDTSVGGHIQSGESVESAVLREAMEETGISINFKNIKFIAKYVFESDIEKELVNSYIYKYDGKIKFQESEIDEVRFFGIEEINALIADKKTTPNFINEFEILTQNNCF